MDCKFLVIEDTTSYHGDVFDHPNYKYTCEASEKLFLFFIAMNKNAKITQKNQNKSEISLRDYE